MPFERRVIAIAIVAFIRLLQMRSSRHVMVIYGILLALLTSACQSSISDEKEQLMLDEKDVETMAKSLLQQLEKVTEGLPGTPNYPMSGIYQFLLQYYSQTKDEAALKTVNTNLSAMALGGVNDHIGGGFFHYGTDEGWDIPYFEKTLYDQAQLVSAYSEAYRITKNPLYLNIVRLTLEFVGREMTSLEGGFYTRIEAKTDEEKKFYTWDKRELDLLLTNLATAFNRFYSVTEEGNWNGTNVLRISSMNDVLKEFGLSNQEFYALMRDSKPIVLNARKNRVKPELDSTVLTSWNALMLKGYVDAYRVVGDSTYLEKALKNTSFILDNRLQKTGGLFRSQYESVASAFLDDYSHTIEAFIALFEITDDKHWLDEAQVLADYSVEHFYDKKAGLFNYKSELNQGVAQSVKPIKDELLPSSNSSMAKGLYLLGKYSEREEYIGISKRMLSSVLPLVREDVVNYWNWAQALYLHTN